MFDTPEEYTEKTKHSVFSVEKQDILGLVDEAWRNKGNPLDIQGNRQVYHIDMGRAIGTNGETKVKIVVEGNNIVTAHPLE